MRKNRNALIALVCALLLLPGCAAEKDKTPTSITVWHYYNGNQQHIFDALVQEFNETVGAANGIVVEQFSQGGINDLAEHLLDAAYNRVGASEMPDIFAAYADTAYEIYGLDMTADLSQYMTEEEKALYIPSYLKEGEFDGKGGLTIFPVAKSTELLMLNDTVWRQFAAETGASADDLSTWEGVARLAEQYYRWTDAQTPDVPDDGKAFFGRDAFANYILIGSYQLGTELFEVSGGNVTLNVDEPVMRRLWDNYYVPFINGYFGAYGRFRSDDAKTGDIIAMVCSSSGATYFPSEVTNEDGSTAPIDGAAYLLPNFEGAAPAAVQQGAGMVVTRSTEDKEKACVTFLKWLTEPEQNVRFALSSGYMPVTYAGNDENTILTAIDQSDEPVSDIIRSILPVCSEISQNYDLYTTKPFKNGLNTRDVVNSSMADKAAADRAAVLELMAGGVSREDAVAQYDTDENFRAWLDDFTAALKAAANS